MTAAQILNALESQKFYDFYNGKFESYLTSDENHPSKEQILELITKVFEIDDDFAFKKAVYVHKAAGRCSHEWLCNHSLYATTLEKLRKTPDGLKYLVGVTVADIEDELRVAGSFSGLRIVCCRPRL